MAQILMLPGGGKLDVDRVYMDGGKLPVYAMMGGSKVVMEKGSPAKVPIYQKGQDLFTIDRKPATEQVLRPWLDDPDLAESVKAVFQRFLDRVAAGKPVKTKLETIRSRRPARRQERPFRPEEAGLSSKQAEKV